MVKLNGLYLFQHRGPRVRHAVLVLLQRLEVFDLQLIVIDLHHCAGEPIYPGPQLGYQAGVEGVVPHRGGPAQHPERNIDANGCHHQLRQTLQEAGQDTSSPVDSPALLKECGPEPLVLFFDSLTDIKESQVLGEAPVQEEMLQIVLLPLTVDLLQAQGIDGFGILDRNCR